ncbi:hypothetical protein MHIB_05610 [Mycolicibacter hiberniae]|uniref:Transposase n=1 Tax=Mycolicibacter hiberniae TaxID=29314 RepID=A0A7I7X002_9MYCO|nr:hypothetical protein MHIB_05610 [Mycolicibacter hiberniae]
MFGFLTALSGTLEDVKAPERNARDRRVRRMVAAGKSYRDAAAAVGLRSPASVHEIVHRGRGMLSRQPSDLDLWRANGVC